MPTIVQTYKPTNIQMNQCTNVRTYERTIVQTNNRVIVQRYNKCTNVQKINSQKGLFQYSCPILLSRIIPVL